MLTSHSLIQTIFYNIYIYYGEMIAATIGSSKLNMYYTNALVLFVDPRSVYGFYEKV